MRSWADDTLQEKAAALTSESVRKRIGARRRLDDLVRFGGLFSISVAGLFLLFLLATIVQTGIGGFLTTNVTLELDIPETQKEISSTDIVEKALRKTLEPADDYSGSLSEEVLAPIEANLIEAMVFQDSAILGDQVILSFPLTSALDQVHKGNITTDAEEADRRVSDRQIEWFNRLRDQGLVSLGYNAKFFTEGNSQQAENAGFGAAIIGSLMTIGLSILMVIPVGVLAAIYIEEFAPDNVWTRILEVNINNLAALPGIVFGLLGLAFFLGVMDLPRSAALVAGMTLALMIFPAVFIGARAAIARVPTEQKIAASALGASPLQVVFHHTLPSALSGIVSSSVLAVARALGEASPLLVIGMVAFIVDVPSSVNDPATVMHVQIFLWSDDADPAFIEKAGAAAMFLLAFLFLLNGLAAWLRAVRRLK